MRAVNLIPEELRRGTANGRTSVGGYVIVGVLALAVVMVATFTLTTHSLSSKRATLATVQRHASEAEARAGDLAAYTKFTSLREKRVDTVRSLASSRFDWAHTLRDLSRVLPTDAWLSSVRATVSPTVSVDGTTDPLRSLINAPAIEIVGCTKNHDAVAAVIADLRRMDGVQRVSLSSSKKNDASNGSSAVSDGGAAGDCTQGSMRYPKFSVTAFFTAPTTSSSTPQAPSAGGSQ